MDNTRRKPKNKNESIKTEGKIMNGTNFVSPVSISGSYHQPQRARRGAVRLVVDPYKPCPPPYYKRHHWAFGDGDYCWPQRQKLRQNTRVVNNMSPEAISDAIKALHKSCYSSFPPYEPEKMRKFVDDATCDKLMGGLIGRKLINRAIIIDELRKTGRKIRRAVM